MTVPIKPRSAVVVQIVAYVITAAIAVSFVRTAAALPPLSVYFLLRVASRVFLLALCVYTLVGLYRRKPGARWSGLCGIALLFAVFFSHNFISRPANPYRIEYADPESGVVWDKAGGALFLLLIVYWGYGYAFSKKARAFFGVQ